MKTTFVRFLWVLGILVFVGFGGLMVSNYYEGRFQELEDQNEALLLQISAIEKGLPDSAKYFKVVKVLDKAAKGKMTTVEIVDVARIIVETCALNQDLGLTEDLIFGLIERESGFNPRALSNMNAYGLTQCIRATFDLHLPSLGYPQFTEELAYNASVNLRVGLAEMLRLRRVFLEDGIDSWHIILSAYYYGERPVWGLLKNKREDRVTLEYGKGVVDLAKKWKEVV